MNHTDYAIELNDFSYKIEAIDLTPLGVSEETIKRVRVSKLYYALFHRVLEELPDLQKSTAPGKHEQIVQRLEKHSGNLHTEKVLKHFKDLKMMREWADYQPSLSTPNSNMSVLFKKTYSFIMCAKIFPSQ